MPRAVLCQGSTCNMRPGIHCVFFPKPQGATIGLDDLICLLASAFFVRVDSLTAPGGGSLHSFLAFPQVDGHMAGLAGKVLPSDEAADSGNIGGHKGMLGHLPWRASRPVDFSRRNGWHVGVPCLLSLCSEFGSFDCSDGYEHAVSHGMASHEIPPTRKHRSRVSLGGRRHGVHARQATTPFAIPRLRGAPGHEISTVRTTLEGRWTSTLCTVFEAKARDYKGPQKTPLYGEGSRETTRFPASLHFVEGTFSFGCMLAHSEVARRGMHS